MELLKRVGSWVGRNAIPLTLAVWFAFLATWIVTRGSDLGEVVGTKEATWAASERVVQMTQWTVTTVLTLGGALIGLNWYQNERRYQEDKSSLEKQVGEGLGDLKRRVDFLEFVSSAQLQMSVYQAVSNKVGSPEDVDFVKRCIEEYRTVTDKAVKSAIASVLRQYAIAASQSGPEHYTRQGISMLRDFTAELRKDFSSIANEISVLLAMVDSIDRGEAVDRRG